MEAIHPGARCDHRTVKVRLAGNDPESTETSRLILEQCPILFEDSAEVRSLENWLWSLRRTPVG